MELELPLLFNIKPLKFQFIIKSGGNYNEKIIHI